MTGRGPPAALGPATAGPDQREAVPRPKLSLQPPHIGPIDRRCLGKLIRPPRRTPLPSPGRAHTRSAKHSSEPSGAAVRCRSFPETPQWHWSGREFELVTYLHTWGEHRAYFRHEGEHLVSVPATWTDIVAEDPVVLLGAGRSLFRVADLLELTELIERLRQSTVKETMP
jgi:hypothetical protein